MVQSAEAKDVYNFGSSHSSWLYRPSLGRIFVQGVVDTVLLIVVDVITNQPQDGAHPELVCQASPLSSPLHPHLRLLDQPGGTLVCRDHQ